MAVDYMILYTLLYSLLLSQPASISTAAGAEDSPSQHMIDELHVDGSTASLHPAYFSKGCVTFRGWLRWKDIYLGSQWVA